MNLLRWTLLAVIMSAPAMMVAQACEDDGNRREWSLAVNYPSTENAEVDRLIREWVEAALRTGAKYLAENMAENPLLDPPTGLSVYTITHDLSRPGPEAISVIFMTYRMVPHAAHPSITMDVLSYSLATGKALALDNLFADPDEAVRLIAGKMPERITAWVHERDEAGEATLTADNLFMEGLAPTRENYSQVALEPDGVRVYFQKYAVLPGVFGVVDILIPLAELAGAGPSRAIWPDPPEPARTNAPPPQ
jgi:hypothetical protein